jgi:hypothetical protein
MRTLPIVLSAILVTGCGAPGDRAGADPATASSVSIADFAGTWENIATLEGVPDPIRTTISGSAAGDDWTMSLPERDGIPLLVSVSGDSLVGQSAEYESILRPGVMVTVRTASVLRDGGLVGTIVATYRTADGTERVAGTVRGTRTP